MKNVYLSTLALLLLVSGNVLGATRETQYNVEGQSNFQSLGATGSQQTGNPGYIALTGTDSAGTAITYYLWVDISGNLKIASYPTISLLSSFPSGDWRGPAFTAGTKVGSQ